MILFFIFFFSKSSHFNFLKIKMPLLLPADCLNEIFENLEDDKITLHSCLLVNRFWCKISVRILWRDIFKYSVPYKQQPQVESAILNTLIACLPNELKEHLLENEFPSQRLFQNHRC